MKLDLELESMQVEIGGVNLIFETGTLAKQAGGSVLLKAQDSVILSTVCGSKKASDEVDFLPLRVDYQEKFSGAGKSLNGYIKREGRPTQRETLVCRLIDRPIRPLFPKGYYNDVQIITTLLSHDEQVAPHALAFCATSAALLISDLPFTTPVAAVAVGYINNIFVINPTLEQQKESKLDLLLAGSEDAILMIEGYCDFLTEDQVIEAIETGHKAIKKICESLSEWQKKVGKEKDFSTISEIPQEAFDEMNAILKDRLKPALAIQGKKEREHELSSLKEDVFESLFPKGAEAKYKSRDIALGFKQLCSKTMRDAIIETNTRPDGRRTDEVRPISITQSLLPRAHGSSVFTRGETQALAVATIGGETMAQRFETIIEASSERFYLQYQFPPFSVGEVGRMGPASRREQGHGKLAERAIMPVLPDKTEFPYVIRLESNVLESNGSSSMASVCGGCLALMDAGIPIQRPISGIAMGLILQDDHFVILSDISGTEDSLGDMDFKLTGDGDAITAFQMDIKVEGITTEIMHKALMQAKQGRQTILEKMISVCPKHRESLSQWAPKIEVMQVKPSKIALVIGPGGKQIRAIIEETGVDLDIDDDGVVSITGVDADGVNKAREIIENIVADVEIGRVYDGKIVSIVNFGLFVSLVGGKEGLCHISEIAHTRIETLEGLFKEGQDFQVKVLDINDRGQIKLSHKATLDK